MKSKLTLLLTMALMIGALGVRLHHRAQASAGAIPAAASPFIGTWHTHWNTAEPPGPDLEADVVIFADTQRKNGKVTRDSNALDGMDKVLGANSVMYGTLSEGGRKWSGNWWNTDGVHGTFTFSLKGDKTFEGTYTKANVEGEFKWWGNK